MSLSRTLRLVATKAAQIRLQQYSEISVRVEIFIDSLNAWAVLSEHAGEHNGRTEFNKILTKLLE